MHRMSAKSLVDRKFLQALRRWKQASEMADHIEGGVMCGRAWTCSACFLHIHSQVLRRGAGGSVRRNWMALEDDVQVMLFWILPANKNACLPPVFLQWCDSHVVASFALPADLDRFLGSSSMWTDIWDCCTLEENLSLKNKTKQRPEQTLKETM